MVLIYGIQFAEIATPAPYSYDQIRIFFGMFLRIEQFIPVYGVQLELMSAVLYENFHQLCNFCRSFLIFKNRIVELQRQRPAVAHPFQVGFDKRFYHR